MTDRPRHAGAAGPRARPPGGGANQQPVLRPANAGALAGGSRPRWPALSVRASMLAVCLAASLALVFASPSPVEGCGGCGSGTFGAAFVRVFTDDDGVVDRVASDPRDDGTDPGYDKAVARCAARIVGPTRLQVTITNAYPSYTCTFWAKVRNVGNREIRYRGASVRPPAVLTVTDRTAGVCGPLKPGKTMETVFSVHVEQAARPMSTYLFDIDLRYEAASCTP